jgi:hypothetical protein
MLSAAVTRMLAAGRGGFWNPQPKRAAKKSSNYMSLTIIVPNAAKELFRTAASLRFAVSKNQVPDLVPGVDYRVVKAKYV